MDKNPFSTILGASVNVYKEEFGEEAYLEGLANKFVQKDPKNFSSVRSIVLDVHFRLETILNIILKWYLCFYNKKKIFFSKEDYYKLGDVVSNIDYAKKLAIVELLKIFNKQTVKIFWKTNDLRVAFSHNYKKDSPKYLFYGESIFKRKSVDKLIDGLELVREEFLSFIVSEDDASPEVNPEFPV
ncbi:MAG: hypothetical protein WDL87_03430 [Candidatus Omnitrophota bacterium]|jgi:hypothetical protein